MSTIATFTNDTLSQTWSSSNKSDSSYPQSADGGSITRKLGNPSSQSNSSVIYSSDGSAANVHMGTWVTDPAPESVTLPNGCSFGLNNLCGYESSGLLNAYVAFKVSVVTESGGVLSFNRTLTNWKTLNRGGSNIELGTSAASSYPMGGASTSGGINTHAYTTAGDTIASGERIAVEIGITTSGRSGQNFRIEYGSHGNTPDDATLSAGSQGTGPYGTEIILPINFSEAYQDAWGAHPEITVPWVSGTDTISWANTGTDWTAAKWTDTGAKRYVNRWNGSVNSQFWIFQDDDYLYMAINYIQDGCIQSSDHHKVFICAGSDWEDSLETDPDDWQFCRDITSGTSATRSPVLPSSQGDGNDDGEYVLQGLSSATYPENWEIPSYASGTKTFTFASNGYTWQDGVDWRFGGPGATSAAPNPGGSPAGAYSELKVKKSKLNNWNGYDSIGIMIITQCDVQGNGSTMFPWILGNQVDKSDWPWCGINYFPADAKTASSKTSQDDLDFRALMSGHAHWPLEDTGFAMFFGCNF